MHIAIPTHDLDAAIYFYSDLLGADVARQYDDRVTFKFFDHQLVCHLDVDYAPSLNHANPLLSVYPRHFGVTFLSESDLRKVHSRLEAVGWDNIQPIMTRFNSLPERHLTFFVADPTHNIVEFKWYESPKYIY